MKRIPTDGLIGRVALREAATSELNQMMGLVRAALQVRYDAAKKPTESYVWFEIEAMYADRVIVCKDGRYWQFDYTIDAGNNVQLAEPKEVIEQFLPVKLKEALQIRDAGEVAFLEAAGADGKAYHAVLVRSGLARNSDKTFYTDAALRESAPVFEGARVFAKADIEHLKETGKSVRNIVGWVSGAKFVEGKNPDTGHVAGTVNFTAGTLRDTIADAWGRGKRDLVALSIDAIGKAKLVPAHMREAMGGAKRVVASITKVNSVDVIVDASAGGALVRLVESADSQEQGDMKLKERMLATIKEKKPAVFVTINAETVTDEQLEAHYREALTIEPAAGDNAPATVEQVRMIESRAKARGKISASSLPQPAKDKLQARFDGLTRFVEADVDNEIKAEREYLARFTEGGKVQLGGLDIQTEDRPKKVAEMLDAFFDPAHKDHRATQSFKECYIEMTGDKRVTGRLENCDKTRMAESLGAAFRESLDSASWANVLGNSITRRLIADYKRPSQYDIWRELVSVVPIGDFRTNERTRFGGYGDLATVNQAGAYLALTSPTDEKATYAVAKKGGTEDVTLEMIKNDDVGAIRQIPVKLSRAGKRTLSKFVLDFLRTNPTIYDTVAFFHATHNNLGAAALDATSLAARRLAMLKQTEADSLDRLGIGPKNLIVPVDLQEAAVNLFNRNTNNDKTFVNAMTLQILPVWYWTDTNDWVLGADPTELPSIEIGFLDGNEEPELFVQDMPNVGSMFTNDKVTYKIRFIFGGAVTNFRGYDKSVV